MTIQSGSIHDVLTRKNPTLDVKTKKGSNTRDQAYFPIEPEDIRLWRDFDYKHLVNGWGHVMALEGASGRFETELSDSQKEIIDKDKIDSVAESWNIENIRDPLKKGANFLRGTDQPDVTIKKKYIQFARPNRKPLELDMAIFLRDGDRITSTSLVTGYNMCETKWDHVKMMETAGTTEYLGPVRQILTYAVAAKTRYGWVMTTSEIAVFRVSKKPGTPSTSDYTVEWSFVPWSNSGEGKLTVNLAIWWLGMMSLADKHRQIVLPSEMYPINTWWKKKDGKGYTHVLSGRTVKVLPEGECAVDE
ncbi:hypothetical protein diail_2680 [Diaporthe ilicicola]|nr:hypothetical protein diail_2680 [Diaporthe ilicicola]